MSAIRTRFAPSPTYYLHLGHAASAFHVWQAAETLGAEVLLRIEDIDTTRCRPEYRTGIYEDLEWLGLSWSGEVRIQSEHFPDYARVVERLTDLGLTYKCFRSRTELAALANPRCPGPHTAEDEMRLSADGAPFAWRLSLAAARAHIGAGWMAMEYRELTATGTMTHPARPDLEGDFVLARKDSPSAYHVASTHDDEWQQITHIIRGVDLIDAPHAQTLLQVLMGWQQPVYQHHPLVLDEDGKKLSKSQQSISLASLRADGMTADQIRRRLGFE